MKRMMFVFLLLSHCFLQLGFAKVKVVTSLSDLADFTRVIGGERVDVEYLVRGSQNPHYIDVKPSYMLKLKSADIFIIIGMQVELWAQQIIDGSRNPNLLVIDCSRNVKKLEVPASKLDASAGDVHPFGNPHYWLDPDNVRIILQEILEALTKIAPADHEYFKANMSAYIKKLDGKIAEWNKLMQPVKGGKFVSYHTSFSYLADHFGLSVVGYVEPKPGIPPTPSHTTELIQLMRNMGIKMIGLEQYFEENTPTQIAEAANARVVRLCTSVGGLDKTDDYISLMDYNVHQLIAGLK